MNKTKKLVFTALLCALSYVIVFAAKLIPISVISFLKYDPKDVIIVIGGFIFGPLSAFVISLVVSFLELITISETGIIGFLMNVISSAAFACVAASIYKSNRTMKGAIIALISGIIAQTASMIIWNYAITPLYMKLPRAEVVKMLLPIFLPFNVIKGSLNAALTLLIYKPFVRAMGSIGLIEKRTAVTKSSYIAVALTSLFVVALSIGAILILNF